MLAGRPASGPGATLGVRAPAPHSRALRTRLTALAAALCAIPLTAALAASPDGGESQARAGAATAKATAYARREAGVTTGHVTVSGDGEKSGSGTRVKATTANGRGVAEATASASGVTIFDGLVTAGSVEVSARAAGGPAKLAGSVTALAVNGRPVDSSAGASHDLDGHGRVTVLPRGDGGIFGLVATLSRAYGSHPAGSRVTVAFASASASDAPPETKPRPKPKPKEAPRRRPPRAPEAEERIGEREEERPRRRPKRRRAPELVALETGKGYVFPVHGEAASYSNDWGAPRQHTGTHQGTDIFAPTGTPVLAVADGRLYRVGTRRVPGNRLWLRGPRGDTFFYAHLSAFAHDARNGADVKAGDVIGFVGSTGDAEQTPPHLHFEIHPRDGEAVNPYPFLRAWQDERDVPNAAWLARYGNDPGSRPGALVVVRDYLARP